MPNFLFKIFCLKNEVLMEDCIFCKIANGELGTEFLYEDDSAVVFKDLNPTAPHHLLVVPKKHVQSLNELEDRNLMADLLSAVKNVTKKLGIKEFRTVINTGKEAGQSVFHLHIHVIAGRPLDWPPG